MMWKILVKTLDSKYKKFHKSYPNADKRMKAIMNNIIKIKELL